MAIGGSARIFGRSKELEELDQLLRRAHAGTRQIALIEGPGGIGKSALLRATLDTARDNGFRVRVTKAEELERIRPFAAISNALGCSPDADEPRLAAIADMISEASAMGPDARFTIVDAIVDEIDETAVASPTVLAIDDLQWVDASTVLAIEAVSRRLPYLPIAILLSFRPLSPASPSGRLAETLLGEGATCLSLEPLDDGAIEAILRERLGLAPDETLLRQMQDAAGNPLFVTELLRALETEGAIRAKEGMAHLRESSFPPNLGLTILRRISVLSEDALQLLKIASMFGSSFSAADLSAVMRRPAAALLPALDEVVRAGVIEERGPTLSFRHDLIRLAVYDDVPESVRSSLHAEIARVLIASGASLLKAAEHIALGAQPNDLHAVQLLRDAAREAVPTAAESAVELLQRALELLAPHASERTLVLSDLVVPLMMVGRIQEAEETARTTLSEDPPPDVRERSVQGLLFALMLQDRFGQALGVAREAAEDRRIPDVRRHRFRTWTAHLTFLKGHFAEALSSAREATAMAERKEAQVSIADGFSNQSVAIAESQGRMSEALRLAGLARRAGLRALREENLTGPERFEMLWIKHTSVAMGVHVDALAEALGALEEGRATFAQSGFAAFRVRLHATHGLVAYLQGDWDEASTEFETFVAECRETGRRMGLVNVQAARAFMAFHRGELEDAHRLLGVALKDIDRASPSLLHEVYALWVEALLIGVRDAEAGADAFQSVWDPNTGKAGFGIFPLYDTIVDLCRLGLCARRSDLAGELASFTERVGDVEEAGSYRGYALHLRGMIDDDERVLGEAAVTMSASPRLLGRAMTQESAAVCLQRKGRASEAKPLFDAALSTYERLGARRDAARLLAAMREHGIKRGVRGQRTRPKIGWKALTPTEAEVARLVAGGLTNRQASERLFVSPSTIQTHLRHIFAKLDIASRVELAAEVSRRVLEEGDSGP